MTVTHIEILTKGKIRIFTDKVDEFVVYKSEVSHLNLQEGCTLTEEQYEKMLHEILIPRAKKRAMHLLEKSNRTEAQLQEKLQQNGYPEIAVEAAIAYVKKFHYVDDLRYACSYVRNQNDRKGKNRLYLELLQKGVKKEEARQALDEFYPEEEESFKIQKWMEKKGYQKEQAEAKEKQKMYQFLLRKGFQSSDILKEL